MERSSKHRVHCGGLSLSFPTLMNFHKFTFTIGRFGSPGLVVEIGVAVMERSSKDRVHWRGLSVEGDEGNLFLF